MSDAIYLSNVRLSFPKVIEATSSSFSPDAAKKFSADFILDPKSEDIARFMGEVGKMATEKWKEQASAVLQLCQAERKLRCYGKGDEKIDKKTYQPYDGYAGMAYISANSNEDRPPKIMRPVDGKEAANAMERQDLARKLYGGCYVNAVVRCWPQDNQFGRAVRCELIALQFSKDGDSFGEGSVDVGSMFKGSAPAGEPAAPSALPSWM